MHRSRDQDHSGAAVRSRFRERIAHLAARSIAEISNRVEWFLRRPRRDQDRLAFKIVLDRNC